MTTTTTTRPRPLGPTSVALRLTCDATVEVAVDPALDDNERDDVAAGRAESQLSFHGADQTSLISTTTSPIASLSPRGRQALERAGRAPTSDETAYMEAVVSIEIEATVRVDPADYEDEETWRSAVEGVAAEQVTVDGGLVEWTSSAAITSFTPA